MTQRHAILAGVVLLLAGAVAAVAHGGVTGGRQPLPKVQLQGYFYPASWVGSISIEISDSDLPRIQQVTGVLPGTCRDKHRGRLVHTGADGAIGLEFDIRPGAPIRADGSFSFTATQDNGFGPHTITMRGRFYGNNALGRVRGRSGDAPYQTFVNCTGDQPFWAKRTA